MSVISSDAGWQGQTFHPAPARQFMVLVEGSGRITTSDGKTRTCSTGTRFLLEDTTGRGHSSEFFEKTTVLVIRMPA
jgi:uncharacterized cupin superfamily protein